MNIGVKGLGLLKIQDFWHSREGDSMELYVF